MGGHRVRASVGLRRIRAAGAALLFVASAWALLLGVSPVGSASSCSPSPHAPVLIQKNSDFTPANGVVSGSGTPQDPFLIANLQFKDVSPGYGLRVDNSKGMITKTFNVDCVQSSFTTSPPTGAALVWLMNVHTATTISNVQANSGEAPGSVGIRVAGSSSITLVNENINKFGFDGVQILDSYQVTVVASKLKAFHNGLTIQDSHDITVGQACNINSANGCNEFTYDDGRGIDVEDSRSIAVIDTITSADDTGGILLSGRGTYDVALTGGMATANGPICPSGTPTGETTDTITGIAFANGTHDVTVSGYTISANGDGAGGFFDIMNGGNGLYLNPCTGAVTPVPTTASGGGGIVFTDTCWHFEYGFTPVPPSAC